MNMSSPIVLIESDEGFAVGCTALPGCWSKGGSEDEAISNIRSAIQEYLADVHAEYHEHELRNVDVQIPA